MGRFKKGESGNPAGKPKGCTDWRSKLRKQLEEAGSDIVESILARATDGDLQAAKLVLDRIVPALKPQAAAVEVALPETAHGPADSILAVIQSVAKGELSPDAGNELVAAISTFAKVKEITELLARLERVEQILNERSR